VATIADPPLALSAMRELQAGIAHSVQFCLRLARAYLDMGLVEAARKTATQVPDEGEEGQQARLLHLEALARQAAHGSVLDLGGRMTEETPGSSWPWRAMAHAAFVVGDRARAEEAALRALAYLPSAQDVTTCLAETEAGTERPSPLELVRVCADVGIGPHATVDCLVPVLWDIRPTTCLFEDGLEFVLEVVANAAMGTSATQQGLLGLARYLFGAYGIRTAFLRYGALAEGTLRPMGKAYFSRAPELHAVVEHLERLYWDTFRNGEGSRLSSEQYLREEGALLGYAECCVEWAARLREAGESIETAAAQALIYEEMTASVLEDSRVPAPALAYSAYEFYPCDPRCPAAEAQGQRMLERYAMVEGGFVEWVRGRVIPLNKARIAQAVGSPPYPQFVRAFNAELFTASLPRWQRSWLQPER